MFMNHYCSNNKKRFSYTDKWQDLFSKMEQSRNTLQKGPLCITTATSFEETLFSLHGNIHNLFNFCLFWTQQAYLMVTIEN